MFQEILLSVLSEDIPSSSIMGQVPPQPLQSLRLCLYLTSTSRPTVLRLRWLTKEKLDPTELSEFSLGTKTTALNKIYRWELSSVHIAKRVYLWLINYTRINVSFLTRTLY